ncbi:A/G-specific DNA-adenine glycosylase [Halohasta litchfieldiae]|jgi:A/G-specific adenine glycosylase|uniref:Adenine DNA glycosylase n=2 Tax=Halohasta litchfieldiae TaxID=1073996 RepID=A0A1H6V4Z2_9EURY|nr:A/G-specific DNA-adenine glycosylase [Halohasta litchfieldiae]SEI99653.1 A/G-specific DNA-adenine glycosylase [Halohasta litchfieldiae]
MPKSDAIPQSTMSDSGTKESAELPDGETVDAIQDALIEWYEADHRSYPWRETDDPYAILVSEIMSQQTQLDRVVEAWSDFLDEWPTVDSLAEAPRGDVVAFWSDHSLGYNNRAKYLHEAANQVVDDYDGEFPDTPSELKELMGVGPYTANAVASFAFNNGDAVVDTNVKRVLYRAFDIPDDDAAFKTAAEELMPEGRSRVWNNAIMELGGVACEKTPKCDTAGCPWREWCTAYETGDFTAPDVPTQPSFEGSRRQKRGRVIRTLGEYDELTLDKLGPRVRVDYGGETGKEWLRELVADLADDGLVDVTDDGESTVVRLQQ